MRESEQMLGSRPGNLPPASRTHQKGRVCEAPGCDTTLSVYNAKKHCWQHAEVTFPNYRGKSLWPGTV